MPRGKKTPPEVVYQIMASWVVTENYNETANNLGLPFSTVKDIVDKNKDKPEFVKLRDKKAKEFSKKADEAIDLAFDRLVEDLGNRDKDIPANHLTNVIGVLTDKKLLLEGKATNRTEIVGNSTIDKLAELAGYERKQ